MSWTALLLACAASYALKVAGLLVPASWLERPAVRRLVELLPVALLGALVAVQATATGRHLTIDARMAGLAAGAIAVWFRANLLVVVLVAAVTAAALRAVT